MTRLNELGERRILAEIIPRYARGVGDDCAELTAGGSTLTLTNDPVPPPAASIIGGDPDPYWMGWLLVTINASDVAASGGNPRAFLAALDMPADWPIDDLNQLLSGIRAACDEMGFDYIGGNIRESKVLAATGFAVGECEGYLPLRRSGASVGDLVVSIGQGGQFWCDAMHVRAGGAVDKVASPLFRPIAKNRAMSALAASGLVVSSMDVSDGLLPTLEELSAKSELGIVLNLDNLRGQVDHGGYFDTPARAWLGWGDWNVVVIVRPEHIDEVATVAIAAGTVAITIGAVTPNPAGLMLSRGDVTCPAPRLESERFAADSWFSKGIDGYIETLMSVPLP